MSIVADEHDDSDPRIQVGGDDATIASACVMCSARARVYGRVVRAGVVRMTIVTNLHRPAVGPHAVQTSRALLAFADEDDFATGVGASMEEAIVEALDASGRGGS